MTQVIVNDIPLEQARNTARLLYAFHAATFLLSLGLLSIVPVIINYVKRPETAGTLVWSHHTWMINSFWVYILLMFVAIVMAVTIVLIPLAWLVATGAWIWKAYRLVRGFVDLNNNRAMG